MSSPIEALASRVVGAVESVNTDVINVRVDSFAPHTTALNTGTPIGFPRINGYLLVPNELGATVCVITAVQIERQPYPKHERKQNADLVDLTVQVRLAKLTPLGTLTSTYRGELGDQDFKLQRGVDVFPSVGDPVLLPTDAQLRAVVEGENSSSEGKNSNPDGRIQIGICPTANGAPVHINPNKLFGRHLAILGNTGAGKSCTVAGLIRWSLEAARNACNNSEPNARFIILDPNGEYAQAFSDLDPTIFRVEGSDPAKALKVPAWLWNGEEWSAFTDAAPKIQQPILFDAIRKLRSETTPPDMFNAKVRMQVEGYREELSYANHPNQRHQPSAKHDVASLLNRIADDFDILSEKAENILSEKAENLLLSALQEAAQTSREMEESTKDGQWRTELNNADFEAIDHALEKILPHTASANENFTIDENTPKFFPVKRLPDAITEIASRRNSVQHVDSLVHRIKSLFAAGPLESITDSNSSTKSPSMLENWLENYLNTNQNSNSTLSVLDLSLVPSEVVHIVVAVLARMLFEAVQRHKKYIDSDTGLPTVLILDEAHTFVRREFTYDSATNAEKTCCRTFERIAREGRKFGFGLVIASQRPSEISPTVLSQCNTFLLHRIVNDEDQKLVRSAVPDGLSGFLRELPSLPSRRAVLLGWGAPTPLLTEIQELPENHRPNSSDPDFWSVWTRIKKCTADWPEVRKHWISPPKSVATVPESENLDKSSESF